MTKGKKITTNQVLKELKGPALIVLGMAGGSIAGKAIDKALKVDPNKTSFDVKALAKPIVQLSAGIGGALLLKDANMKLVASGVGASGVASSVKSKGPETDCGDPTRLRGLRPEPTGYLVAGWSTRGRKFRTELRRGVGVLPRGWRWTLRRSAFRGGADPGARGPKGPRGGKHVRVRESGGVLAVIPALPRPGTAAHRVRLGACP